MSRFHVKQRCTEFARRPARFRLELTVYRLVLRKLRVVDSNGCSRALRLRAAADRSVIISAVEKELKRLKRSLSSDDRERVDCLCTGALSLLFQDPE